MVPISDVKAWNSGKLGFDRRDPLRFGNDPGRVAHTVACGEIHARRPGAALGDEFINPLVRAKGEEDRPGLCLERLDVPQTVVFFIWPRQLVLPDDAPAVILA